MSKPLVSASVAAPGFFGLNSQQSSVTLEDGYASEATNCIIDKYGRLGARKGWVERATVETSTFEDGWIGEIGPRIVNLTEVVSSGTLTRTITFGSPHPYASGSTVYIDYYEVASSPPFSITLTYQGNNLNDQAWTVTSDTVLTFTTATSDSDRTRVYPIITSVIVDTDQFNTEPEATFVTDFAPLKSIHRFVNIAGTETIITNNEYGFYSGIAGTLTNLVLNSATNTTVPTNVQSVTLNDKAYFFQESFTPLVYDGSTEEITDVSDSNCPKANTVLSAYGRLWAARTTTDKMTVYWSDLLDGENWSTGSAGSIDLTAIMVQGTDEIVGLGAQNGRLIVFTKRSIVIFADSTGGSSLDPAALVLVEVINRVGCVARDSIQNTGTDIIFLSEDGLRSLGRVIQEKSQPMRDLSANIRDELVQAVQGQNLDDIKSVYSEDNAFYLLLLPQYNRIYCFDTRAPLPNGALRVTVWNNQEHTNILSLPNDIYFTNSNGLCQYSGYLDNTDTYRMIYFTNYFDLGLPTQTKLLKKLKLTVIGLVNQDFIIKNSFDYIDSYRSQVAQLTGTTGAEYGTAEYNIAEYSVGTVSEPVSASMGGSGSVMQVGFETDVNGSEFSIQKIDIYAKQGRVI